MHKREELLACFGLWAAREIASDNLDLVELADLYRDTLENLEKSSPSIDHGRSEHPAALFKNGEGIAIVGHELALYLVPPDVPCERPGTEDADAIPATPEGRVGDDDRRVRCNLDCWHGDRIEPIAHPDVGVPVPLRQLCERLLLLDICLPEFSAHPCISFE